LTGANYLTADFKDGFLSCNNSCKLDLSDCIDPNQQRNRVMAVRHFAYNSQLETGSSPSTAIPEKGSSLGKQNLVDKTSSILFDKDMLGEDLKGYGWFSLLPYRTMMIGSPVFHKGVLYFSTYTKYPGKIDDPNAKLTCGPEQSELSGLGFGYLWAIDAYSGNPDRETLYEYEVNGQTAKKKVFIHDGIIKYLGPGIPSEPKVVDGKIVTAHNTENGNGSQTPIGTPYNKPLHQSLNVGDNPCPMECRVCENEQPVYCSHQCAKVCDEITIIATEKATKILWWKEY